MKVIKPLTWGESMLVSSTAPEPYAAYNPATTYAKDARVDYQTHIYISLVDTNLGNTPSTSPTQWLLEGPCNVHAMFDLQVSTQTTGATPLTVEVYPAQVFNSVAVVNIDGATTLDFTVQDGSGGPVVYARTVNLDATPIEDWYMYFFEPYDFLSDVVLTDLPPYSSAHLTVSATTASGDVSVGGVVMGSVYDIGSTQMGVSLGIKDYSLKTTDEFGTTTFTPRGYSKRMEPTVFLPNTRLGFVYKLLASLSATPVVWIGSDDPTYTPLIQFGFFRDFNIEIPYPNHSLCRLNIEGLN